MLQTWPKPSTHENNQTKENGKNNNPIEKYARKAFLSRESKKRDYKFGNNGKNSQETNRDDVKRSKTGLINEISSVLINATVRTNNEFCQKKKRKRKIGELKYKYWWEEVTLMLHNKVAQKYIQYRDTSFSVKNEKEYKKSDT